MKYYYALIFTLLFHVAGYSEEKPVILEVNDVVYDEIRVNLFNICVAYDSTIDASRYVRYSCKNEFLGLKRRGKILHVVFVYNDKYYGMKRADTALSGISRFGSNVFGCEIRANAKIDSVKKCLEARAIVEGVELVEFKSLPSNHRMSTLSVNDSALYVDIMHDNENVLSIEFSID